MRKESAIEKESFDALLRALDPEPNRAGELYLKLRQRLIVYFVSYGAADPESLSDETLDRVAARVGDRDLQSREELRSFALGVARNIRLEYFKMFAKTRMLDESHLPEFAASTAKLENIVEDRLECLSGCLDKLERPDRKLVLAYYRYSKRDGIVFRRKLAERERVTITVLHMRVNRLRVKIRKCILNCLKKNL